ncbi:MAG: ATP-binding cassette domain-containing protein [Clostridiales bacterium]|nr:ATP-binding cassette domain-containing protein [Clostridiales bacterium]
MEHIIQVDNLSKSYGDVHAVKRISFFVEKGKLFAFLGPNGAGKSTTINMICTFLKPNGGSVTVNGYQLGKEDDGIRNSIGVVFQDGLLDSLLTIEENYYIRGALYGLSGKALKAAVRQAIHAVSIEPIANRRYGKLSGGQRRRADIGRALITQPEILFLDEPTTGLDPHTRRAVWDTILDLQKTTGMTVFLTTHYMEEADGADYVIVIDDGKIAAKGTPTDLSAKYAHDKLYLNCSDMDKVKAYLKEQKISYTQVADNLIVGIGDTFEALPIIEGCREHLKGFEVTVGSMDDAFIGITGKELRE